MQNEYANHFNTELYKLNESTKSENNGQLSALEYFENMSTVLKTLGSSPKEQVLDWLNKNKNNYKLETKTSSSEIPEWRSVY